MKLSSEKNLNLTEMNYESIFALCFTPQGERLSEKICAVFGAECQAEFFCLSAFGSSHAPSSDFVKEAFDSAHSGRKTLLVFVGAMGISVRSVAPFILKKTCDPAVLCVDDSGKFVIPILSCHIGGANRAASFLSEKLGAQAVVTTSTDVNGKWAYDSWCVAHGKKIVRPEIIKKISGRVLRGEKIFSVGIGCKKGVGFDVLESFVQNVFSENNLDFNLIKSISSIDIKKNEDAIIAFSEKYKIPAFFYSAEKLNGLPGKFSSSDFVLGTVGVDCVCERAAMASAMFSELLLGKHSGKGVTVSVAL